MTIVRILAAVLFSWLAPAWALAQERPYQWGWGMHPMWSMGGAWGVGMMLMMFVFWALIIVAAFLGIRWLLRRGKTP